MTKVEELQVIISANADQFKSELVSVKQELQRLNSSTSDITRGFGSSGLFGGVLKANLATSVITKTVGTLVNTFKGLTSEIVDNGSQLARLRIANSAVTANMGMTSEQVQKLRDDLMDANTWGINAEEIISTLALSGLIKLAEGLEYVDARSGKTEAGVTALTLAIKDLAAARGIESDLGIQRISKFIQRGEATFADGLIEIGNLNDEYRAYADTLGKTVADLSANEKAQVRLNLVMREGAKSFGAYAATYNSSGKIMQSVGMLLKGTLADIGANLESVFRVGSLAMLEFLRGIQGGVMEGANAIKSFANTIAGYMVALVRLVGKLLQNLPLVGAGFKRWATFTLQPIQAQGKLADAVGGVGTALSDTTDEANKLGKALDSLAGFDELNVLSQDKGSTASVASGGGGLADTIGGINDVEDATATINDIASGVEKSFEDIGKSIETFLRPAIEWLTKAWNWLDTNVIQPAVLWWNKNVTPTLNNIGTAISWMVKVIEENIPPFLTAIQPLTDAIGNLLGGALQLLGDILGWVWKEILKPFIDFILASVVPAFKPIVDFIVNQLVPAFVEIATPLVNMVMPTLNLLWAVFKLVFESVKRVVEQVWNETLLPIFTSVGTFLITKVIPNVQKFYDKFVEIFNKVKTTVETVWSGIKSSIETVVNWITNIPATLGALKTGIESIFKGVETTVNGIWENIKSGIKSSINSVIRVLNDFIKRVNFILIDIDRTVDLGAWQNFTIGHIPFLASGGIVDSPTLAMIGEGGKKEAVLPLEDNTSWMETLATKINGTGGGTQHIVIKIGEDTILDRVIEGINDKALSSNLQVLNI